MSIVAATSRIVEALDDHRLLSPELFHELITQLLPRCDDWSILAPELVYRGWLTPFQMTALLKARPSDLILGSYVLEEPIGEGGMGRIFLARNWKLDTRAAVKVIRRERASEPAAVERFLREVRALGAIRHQRIVHALDAGMEGGRLYCAMEYVPGTDLGRLLQTRGALPVEMACRYAAQIAEALRHIARLGLVHRDVKPGNVLIAEDGNTVKLSDLGLARFDSPNWAPNASELTQVGTMIGTPDYVSPEQIRDSKGADIRSDLYSLGCTLYHMLAGRPPCDGPSTVQKLHQQQSVEPIPIEQLRPDVPADVAALVRSLMAKKSRDRCQDPSEVLAMLQPYLMHGADTITDAASPTAPGLPLSHPVIALPRTEELTLEQMTLHAADAIPSAIAVSPLRVLVIHWLNRLHWLIAAVIAGLALGLVLRR
jgi:eukaryotic-like serine/threonine-protein kinase